MATQTVTKRAGLPSVFDDFFRPWKDWASDFYGVHALTVPAVNVTEDKESYRLSMAAPGLKKSDFKIELEGELLTISAETETEKEEKSGKYSRQEYNYSSFSRSFHLPEGVSKDKIDAHYDDGVLKIRLPKNEDSKKNGRNMEIPVK
ncbi:Hsp20/alpha crystallin family protein [Chitinophaga qingshengii]|uniref:Hsp20/alpha crystallin family protein n=1 Tax=Chitinophaga qingshengii TaxID=1569794 RepID=A0ABR7TIF7_9BACT|nr:Hsp20/alpha crystallin family protein [Chitinophaga qingshengii]MBC9929425.1 Hsp20/alpha crystallin family protein [Chitinophaga qingshengii]